MRNHLWSTVALIVMSFLAAGSFSGSKSNSGGDAKISEEVKKSAMVVSPQELISAYSTNGVAADGKYKDKWVQITGNIEKISKDIGDTIYVTFKSGGKYTFESVQCYFDDKHTSKAASLVPGQQITVIGKCTGKLANIHVKNCEFVE